MSLWDRARAFTERGLGVAEPFMFVGGALWVATIILASLAAREADGHERSLYIGVAISTGTAMVPLLLDYATDHRHYTFFTVALGSFAYLSSVALWSRDLADAYRFATFVVQTGATAIQLAAIFNQARAPPGPGDGKTRGQTFYM